MKGVILLLLLAGCVEQVVIPNASVATLDDPGSGTYSLVSGGLEHTCALTASKSAFCWGSNEFGQLGADADTTCVREDRRIDCALRPIQVSGNHQFAEVRAGGKHTCGRTTAGEVYCWGDSFHGQLGDPSVRNSAMPIPVVRAGPYTALAVGGDHACALRTDGAAFCWGANESGQLGIGSSGLGSGTPDSVRTALRFVSIVAGARRTCARTGDGALFCWGATWVTRVNNGELLRPQISPLRILPAPPFKAVAVGSNSTCAIAAQAPQVEENAGYCWEANPTGTIGDGTETGNTLPQPVAGGLRFAAITSGASHTCAIADTGLAYCWGDDSFGQLGISPVFLSGRCGASQKPCSRVPVRVVGWRLFVEVTAGQGNHSCGRTLAGNIYCWGAGSLGQRGDGQASFGSSSPRRVPEALNP